jgi:hypothetical protein
VLPVSQFIIKPYLDDLTRTPDAVNQAAAAVEETAGDAGDAIGGVVDQAKDTIAGIFGKLFGREY